MPLFRHLISQFFLILFLANLLNAQTDPKLEWSTYYGSHSEIEEVRKVIPDKFGNVYMMMFTNKYDKALVSSKYDTISWPTIVMVKFDSTGKRIWATFLGPDTRDFTIDDSGNIYFVSHVNSYDMSNGWGKSLVTSNAAQTKLTGTDGYADLLIVKLDSSGQIKWGTLYGGDRSDWPTAVEYKNGFLYIAGVTDSKNIANLGVKLSGYDAFILKMNASDGTRVFGVYISGSSANEHVSDIAIDEQENIYVCGSTSAKTGYSTVGAFQYKPFSTDINDTDGFLLKFDKNGKKKWGTYYGRTEQSDIIKNIAIGKEGNIVGLFCSGKAYKGYGYELDSTFLVKFDSTGKRIWYHKLQDSLPLYNANHPLVLYDYGFNRMSADVNGNICIVGTLARQYYAIDLTQNALRKKHEEEDSYIIIYNSVGERKYASYFGGEHNDRIIDAAGDAWGGFYIGGYTTGKDIHTQNAYDTTSQYNIDYPYQDGFLARIKFTLTEEAGLRNVSDTNIISACENDNARLKLWIKNNGTRKVDSLRFMWTINSIKQKDFTWKGFVPAGDSLLYTFSAPKMNPGNYNVKIWIKNGDANNDTITFSFRVDSVPVIDAGQNKAICFGETVELGGAGNSAYRYQWSAEEFNDTAAQPTVNPSVTTTYYLTVTNLKTGCVSTDSVKITVNPLPQKRAGKDQTICAGEKVMLGDTMISNYKYFWSEGTSIFDTIAQPIVQPKGTTVYTLTVTDSNGCSMSDTVVVNINQLPVVQSISGEQYICKNGTSWYGYKKAIDETLHWTINGGTLLSKPDADSILIRWNSAGDYTLKLDILNMNNCADSTQTNITVFERSNPSFITPVSACVNDVVKFENTSTGFKTYQWNIASETDTNATVTKAFYEPGIYAIWLKTITENGCADSVKQEIAIHALPVNSWKIIDLGNGRYSFAATDSVNTQIRWKLGNGDSSQSSSFSFIYKQSGKYLVQLEIINSNGCKILRDTFINPEVVSVHEDLVEKFKINIYPNPFTENTTVEYTLPKAANVSMAIINVNGKQVTILPPTFLPAGQHQYMIFSPDLNLKSGVYTLRIGINGKYISKQVVKFD